MTMNDNGALGIIGAILIFMFWLVFIGISIFLFVFWIMMIIDVVKREFLKSDDKIIWLLVVILAGQIGAIIYYFVVKRNPEKYSKV